MTVPKPQPRELVIRPLDHNAQYLRITTGSTDATAWIEREAPQFGVLYPPTSDVPYYTLQVSDVWDKEAVQAHLASYSEKEL